VIANALRVVEKTVNCLPAVFANLRTLLADRPASASLMALTFDAPLSCTSICLLARRLPAWQDAPFINFDVAAGSRLVDSAQSYPCSTELHYASAADSV